VPADLGSILLGSDPSAFLCDGTFYYRHNEHKRGHDDCQHPEHIEVGKRRRLLLSQVCERLQSQLLRGDRIAGLLQERFGNLIKGGMRRRVERIKRFAKAEAVELVTTLLASPTISTTRGQMACPGPMSRFISDIQ
jgi:hypothetical protein